MLHIKFLPKRFPFHRHKIIYTLKDYGQRRHEDLVNNLNFKKIRILIMYTYYFISKKCKLYRNRSPSITYYMVNVRTAVISCQTSSFRKKETANYSVYEKNPYLHSVALLLSEPTIFAIHISITEQFGIFKY